jgi:ABC-type uncharacterized transport system involved in gliding motility auxiliary subunit
MPNNLNQYRQAGYIAYAALYTTIIAAVLIALNYLGQRYYTDIDFTANQRYSLSEQTRKIASGLKEDVTISYWHKPASFTEGRDLLDRYDGLSNKLAVRYMDVDKKLGEARRAGIRNLGAITLEMGERREEAKALSEEEITGALVRLVKQRVRTVCFLTGSGERGFGENEEGGLTRARQRLEAERYQTQEISNLENGAFPAACTVVIAAGPKTAYAAPLVQAFRTTIESGGRALFMLDAPLQVGRDKISDNPELTALLASYGVTLNKDMVVDMSGTGQMLGLSPAVPVVRTFEQHPIVREFGRVFVALPIPRSLSVAPANPSVIVEKLFSSGPRSFSINRLNQETLEPNPAIDKPGPHVLGAAAKFNTGKPNVEGRFVVIGSSEFAGNGFFNFGADGDLFLNSMNWLSSDEELISIRPKDKDDRRIELSAGQMGMVRIVSQFLIPLIVLAGGAFTWYRRR